MLRVIYLIAYPNAHLDDIVTFITNTYHNANIYSPGKTSQRLNESKLTKKRGSTEIYQDFTSWNMNFGRFLGINLFLLEFTVPLEGKSSQYMKAVSRYSRRIESMVILILWILFISHEIIPAMLKRQ